MTSTLRVVEAAADLDPDEKVRLVTRMLLGWHRMTTLELGVALGLGRTAIYDRMQGRKAFTVAEVVAMGKIFSIAPEAFLAGPTALLRSDRAAVSGKYQSAPHRVPAPGRVAKPSPERVLYLVAA